MKKRILGMFLAILMVVGMIPSVSLAALAAETNATVLVGDMNKDGALTVDDIYLIEALILRETPPTEEEIAIADVNGDGKVNVVDIMTLKKLIGESETVLVGDMNKDGTLTQEDMTLIRELIMRGNPTAEEIAIADVNGDGDVTVNDIMALKKLIGESETVLLGDMNKDGSLTVDDIDLMEDLILNDNVTDEELAIGDLTGDGKLDVADVAALKALIAHTHDFTGDGECDCGEKGVKLMGSSLLLEGNIGLKFYYWIDESIFADTTIKLTLADGRSFEYKASEGVKDTTTLNGTTMYVFTAEVYAKQMADTVTAVSTVDGHAVTNKAYSVRDYAKTVLSNPNTYGERVVAMVKAMLNYGAAAQVNFEYNDSDLANSVGDLMTEEEKTAYFNVDKSVFDDHKVSSKTIEGIGTFLGYDLVLESETTLNIYFRPADGVDIGTLTFTVDGETVTPVKSGDYYKIVISKIKASDLDTKYTVTVTNGSASGDFTASAFSYCHSAINQETNVTYTDAVKNAIRALYLYNKAANELFE